MVTIKTLKMFFLFSIFKILRRSVCPVVFNGKKYIYANVIYKAFSVSRYLDILNQLRITEIVSSFTLDSFSNNSGILNLELLGNQLCNWNENNLQVLSNKLFSDIDEEKKIPLN